MNFPAKHHISPLHVAAKWGKTNMVKLLLDKGALLDASTRVSAVGDFDRDDASARQAFSLITDAIVDSSAARARSEPSVTDASRLHAPGEMIVSNDLELLTISETHTYIHTYSQSVRTPFFHRYPELSDC